MGGAGERALVTALLSMLVDGPERGCRGSLLNGHGVLAHH